MAPGNNRGPTKRGPQAGRAALYALAAQVLRHRADDRPMELSGVGRGSQGSEAAIAALATTMREAREQGQALVQLIAQTPPASTEGVGRLLNVRG